MRTPDHPQEGAGGHALPPRGRPCYPHVTRARPDPHRPQLGRAPGELRSSIQNNRGTQLDKRHSGRPPAQSHSRRPDQRRPARDRRPRHHARAGRTRPGGVRAGAARARRRTGDRRQGRLRDERRRRQGALHQGRGHQAPHRLHDQDHDREGGTRPARTEPGRQGHDPDGVQRLHRLEERVLRAPHRRRQGDGPAAAVRADAAVGLRRGVRARRPVRFGEDARGPREVVHRQDECPGSETGAEEHPLRLVRRHRATAGTTPRRAT